MKLPIGEFLARIRKEQGYTQREIADKLGISNRTLSAWEQGRAYPDVLTLAQLADIYGVTADEILKGERKERTQLPNLSEPAVKEPAENLTQEPAKPTAEEGEQPSLAHSTGATCENHADCGDKNSEFTAKVCREVADKFALRSKVLTAVHCCGALLCGIGFISACFILWLGILLIVLGVCAVIVSCALLAAFSDGALKGIGVRPRTDNTILTADQNRYALSIGKSCSFAAYVCGAVWCVFALVIFISLHSGLGLIISLLPLCFGLLMIIGAAVGSSSDIKKYGSESQRGAQRANGKLLKKCVGFTAIPVALAVGIVIFFAFWRQTETFVDYKGERGGMVNYMHTAILKEDNYSGDCPYGEYVLDLSEVTTEGEYVRVHQYFYAVLRKDGLIELYTAEADTSYPQGVGAIKPDYFCMVSTIPVPTDGVRVYNVRYGCRLVEYSNVETIIDLNVEDGVYSVVRTEITDRTYDGVAYGMTICSGSVAVCAIVYLVKRKRLPAD